MHGASDDCQDESEYQICADYLRRRHSGIIEQKNGPRAPAPPRKSGLNSDRKGEPRQPTARFPCESLVLHPRTNVTLDEAASNRPSR